PRPCRAVDERERGVIGLGDGDAERADVAAERAFEGGPAVAKQIVGRAQTRRDVREVRHVVDARKVPRRRKSRGRERLREREAPELVEPYSEVQGQPLD